MSLLELALAILIPVLLGLVAGRACDLLQHGHWIGFEVFVGLILIAAIVALAKPLLERRAARKAAAAQQQMQLCYPACDVKRLRSGDWFLTDRATGREYQGCHEGDTHA